MTEIRNLLLIGKSGSGKSTVANVLSGTEKFVESSSSESCTKEIKHEVFELPIKLRENLELQLKYQVIDTIGIDDTSLNPQEVLKKMVDVSNLLKESKIYQILFVIGGKIDEKEIENYNLLKKVIFDDQIVNYTTIIRTRFPNFENEEKCKKEKENLCKNPKIAELINSCNGFVLTDNPPMEGYYVKISQELREKSRKKILEHLVGSCGNYLPTSLAKLEERVNGYKTAEEKYQARIKQLEACIQEKDKGRCSIS